jgi:hypothetical protein
VLVRPSESVRVIREQGCGARPVGVRSSRLVALLLRSAQIYTAHA